MYSLKIYIENILNTNFYIFKNYYGFVLLAISGDKVIKRMAYSGDKKDIDGIINKYITNKNNKKPILSDFPILFNISYTEAKDIASQAAKNGIIGKQESNFIVPSNTFIDKDRKLIQTPPIFTYTHYINAYNKLTKNYF